MVLPVNGTREALFAFVQAAVDPTRGAAGGAAQSLLPDLRGRGAAGRRRAVLPRYHRRESGYQPDLAAVPEAVWRRCQVLFLCSPGNPSGAVLPLEFFSRALDLAERHDFIVASDECYADIYQDEAAPPPGLLEAARSQRPRGLRALRDVPQPVQALEPAGAALRLRRRRRGAACSAFCCYRTYHGSAMPVPTQLGSIAAWGDDAHARDNRASTRRSSRACCRCSRRCSTSVAPAGAFYLWPQVGGDDEQFTRELYARQNITVLPGSYLARAGARGNPGAQHVRISLVPPLSRVRGGRRADRGIPAMNRRPVRDCLPL